METNSGPESLLPNNSSHVNSFFTASSTAALGLNTRSHTCVPGMRSKLKDFPFRQTHFLDQ